MKYSEFVSQTVPFPTEEFNMENDELTFHGIKLMDLIESYGTPLKLTYLPAISKKIRYAKELFSRTFKKNGYRGSYRYCYCTKSSQFRFILEEVVKNEADIETSSAFDIPIIRSLYDNGKIDKDIHIICNGFKRYSYTKNIIGLINDGFKNCIPILDNFEEFEIYEEDLDIPYQVGIRVATEEMPNFEFYTSRLGMKYGDIRDFYFQKIKNSRKAKLRILHFFVSSGMHDTLYFWGEFNRFAELYCELRKECDTLTTLDIGGGLPIRSSLSFEFDYPGIIELIIENLKNICAKHNVPEPDLMTEFGSFTVGESGAVLYSVLNEKLQNDKELWYMLDGSFITHLPDSWGLNKKFILLPLNNWNNPYHKVSLGGITCDNMDYYNSEAHSQDVYLPVIEKDRPQFIGFFHTGAYQESLGGYGGIQHCLIPSPKHLIIDKDENGVLKEELFREEEKPEVILNILGYR